MIPKSVSGKRAAADPSFLHDLDALTSAFSLAPNPKPRKPSSLWKSLKSLAHIRRRRFDCRFTLHVHSITNLPPPLADVALTVHWRRTTDSTSASTRPVRAVHGAAQFDEALSYRCSVYSSRSAVANYDPREFRIWAEAGGMAADDLGVHLVDLTRLLPLTLEELEDEGKRTGRWSTSFRLLGKARGATLSVSFTFSIIGGCLSVSGCGNVKVSEVLTNKPGKMGHCRSRSMEDVKVVHEVLSTTRSDLAELARADYADVTECPFGNSGGDLKPEYEDVCELGGSPDLKPCASGEFVDGENCKLQGIGITDEGKFSGTQSVREMVDNGGVVISETSVDPDDQVELLSGIEQGVRITDEGKSSETESENGECEMIDNRGVAIDSESSADPDEQVKLSSSGNGLGENCGPPRYTDPATSGLANLESAQSCEEQEFSEFMLDCKLGSMLSMVSRSLSLDGATEFEPSAKPDEEMLEFLGHDSSLMESSVSLRNSSMEDLDIAFSGLSIHEWEGVESPQKEAKSCTEQGFRGFKTPCGRMGRSLGLNGDTAESVASEFLNMLGIEHSPFRLSSDSDSESPKEHLWKQFERDTLSIDNSIFGLDEGTGRVSGWGDFSEDFDLASIVLEAETELEKTAQGVDSKSRAKMLEDAETEALMREWGLNEKAFQNSPPGSRGGFGSPINLPPEVPLDLPPLGEGLGPILQTKDGGFVRSMSPSLFKTAKNHESLIMQVSSPVVVPAEMGSGIMDILQGLASVGIEKLSGQAKKLMPLEDISGKTMQQVAWQVSPNVETCKRQEFLQPDACGRWKKARSSNIASCGVDMGSECVSLEDLAPLAMDQIETLTIEGLRVQSGMSDDDAPSSISPLSVGSMSALVGKESNNSESLGVEGATGLQLLNVNDYGDDVDGLMSLSLSLDEWMRLDSGIIDEDQISDRTSKILAAHHACSTDFVIGGSKEGKRGGKVSGRRWGLLGNNFTVALMVQLRNPLRNYEPVGTPMLSLIQVERAFVPPKLKIYNTVLEKGNSEQDEEPETTPELVVKEEMKDEEDAIPQFKVTEVHVAGLKTEPGKKKSWGNQMQQQSGSRWLLATGMGKRNKNPFTWSKTCGKPGDSLWSMSSRADGTGSKWNVRNPDVWFR